MATIKDYWLDTDDAIDMEAYAVWIETGFWLSLCVEIAEDRMNR